MSTIASENFDSATAPAVPTGQVVTFAQAGKSAVTEAAGYSSPNNLKVSGGNPAYAGVMSVSQDDASGDATISLVCKLTAGPDYCEFDVFLRASTQSGLTCNAYGLVFENGGPSVRLYKFTAGSPSGGGLGTAVTGPPAGVWCKLTFAASGTTLTARLQRLDNNQYLTSGGTFQAGATDCISLTDATFSGAGYAGVGIYQEGSAVGRVDDLLFTTATSSATAFTLTGPSRGPAGAASASFTVTPTGGTYTGTITPSGTGCTFSPSSLTWSGANDAKTFTVTKSVAGTVTINGTGSPSLTQPAGVSYTAAATTTRTYAADGGTAGATTGFAVKNDDGTYWADRTTAVTDQGGGAFSIAGVTVPSDLAGIVVWDQGGVIAAEPVDNRPAGSSTGNVFIGGW